MSGFARIHMGGTTEVFVMPFAPCLPLETGRGAFLFMLESMAEMMLFHAKSTYFIIKPNLSKRRSNLCHLSQSACEYRHLRKFYIISTSIFMRFCAINCSTCQSGRRNIMNPIVSKLVSAALSAAGIAVCGILSDVIKEGVSDICDLDLSDF